MRKTLNFAYYFVSEFVYLVLHPLLSFLSLVTKLKGQRSDKGGQAVVLQRGWFTENYLSASLKRKIEEAGFSVYVTNFGFHFGDINKYSRQLGRFIEKHKLKSVYIVGTSLGGLIALNYAQNFGGWKRVKKLVTVASPLKGTVVGVFGFFSKSARQMMPTSEFMAGFLSKPIKHKNRIHSIRAAADELVPPGYSYLVGAHNHKLEILGHENLLYSKNTHKKVVQILMSS